VSLTQGHIAGTITFSADFVPTNVAIHAGKVRPRVSEPETPFLAERSATGSAPAGYHVVGDGPVVGPKQ